MLKKHLKYISAFQIKTESPPDLSALENTIDADNSTCISLAKYKQGAVFDILLHTFIKGTTPGCHVTLTLRTHALQSPHWIVLVRKDNELQENCQTGE